MDSQSLVASRAGTSLGLSGHAALVVSYVTCFGLGVLSLLQAEGIMWQDQHESTRHQLWRLQARTWDCAEREAWYLAYWQWLASQRGETKNRTILAEGVALDSWQYGLRVDA